MNRKFLTRAIALALVIILSLSLLPLASMAVEEPKQFPSEEWNPSGINADYAIIGNMKYDIEDLLLSGSKVEWVGSEYLGDGSKKISFKPAKLVEKDGELYDLNGIVIGYDISDIDPTDPKAPEKFEKAFKKWFESAAANGKTSLTIPAVPKEEDFANKADPSAAYIQALTEWQNLYGLVVAVYGAHQHQYSCWIPDNNNHWAKCLVCGENFLLMNWHYDNDEDDWCDVCGHEIIYYDISIKDVEGAKITVDGDRDMTAPYRDWIEVSVEAEEGYKVTDVRVWKIRENGTKDQITRHIVKRGSEYKFEMQNFDCEIVATVVKK